TSGTRAYLARSPGDRRRSEQGSRSSRYTAHHLERHDEEARNLPRESLTIGGQATGDGHAWIAAAGRTGNETCTCNGPQDGARRALTRRLRPGVAKERGQEMKSILVAVVALAPLMAKDREPVKRLDEAAAVFSEVMAAPDKGIPQELLENA